MENKIYVTQKGYVNEIPDLHSSIILKEVKDHFIMLNNSGGILFAYNTLKSTIASLEDEIEQVFNSIFNEEKWFKKGLNILKTHRNSFSNQIAENEIDSLINNFYEIKSYDYESVNGLLFSLELANAFHYYKNHESILKKIKVLDIDRNASIVVRRMYQFEYLNALQARFIQLCELLIDSGFSSSFDIESIIFPPLDFNPKNGNQSAPVKENKRGPSTNSELKDDINEIIKPLINKVEFMHENGEMNISSLVNQVTSNEQFIRRWYTENPAKRDRPYSERTINTYIKDCIDELKS